MYTIFLNETFFTINNFSRNTYFQDDGTFTSNGYFNLNNTNDVVASLHALAQDSITSLVIKRGENTIYDAGEIDAKIQSIDENLNMDEVNINVNIKFN